RAERRRETRSPRISPCAYGLMRSVNRDGTILEEGHGTAVNDSPTGMRLLLGVAPSKGSFWNFKPAVRRSGVRSVS
ncbi:MAG: hypothetical protein ACREI1_12925, partial [Nitrospiraceae bacterium]